jgi:hypothetical protein
MKNVRRIAALVSGFALYNVLVFVGGFLAALQIPRAYFAWFGPHKVLALVLEEAVTFGLPVFLLALAWSYLTIRQFRGAWWPSTWWCFGGLALAWFAWLIYSLSYLMINPVPSQFPFGTLLLSFLIPPVWGILNTIAAPCGVMLGGRLARHVQPIV